jgi:hypothetical protein
VSFTNGNAIHSHHGEQLPKKEPRTVQSEHITRHSEAITEPEVRFEEALRCPTSSARLHLPAFISANPFLDKRPFCRQFVKNAPGATNVPNNSFADSFKLWLT